MQKKEMTEFERMEAGLLYDPGAEEILSVQSPLGEKIKEFNDLRPSQFEEQQLLMRENAERMYTFRDLCTLTGEAAMFTWAPTFMQTLI